MSLAPAGPRVVVADDLATMRRLLARLAERSGFEVVAEVGTTDALAEAVVRLAPDVALTDVEMPGTPLLEVLEALRERAPGTAVLVHTGHTDGASVQRLTAGGARQVIAKGSPVEHLVAVLRAAVDGGAPTRPNGDPA
ncbi:MAG: response regulator transcription factor [Egibacteraceae bacterium]